MTQFATTAFAPPSKGRMSAHAGPVFGGALRNLAAAIANPKGARAVDVDINEILDWLKGKMDFYNKLYNEAESLLIRRLDPCEKLKEVENSIDDIIDGVRDFIIRKIVPQAGSDKSTPLRLLLQRVLSGKLDVSFHAPHIQGNISEFARWFLNILVSFDQVKEYIEKKCGPSGPRKRLQRQPAHLEDEWPDVIDPSKFNVEDLRKRLALPPSSSVTETAAQRSPATNSPIPLPDRQTVLKAGAGAATVAVAGYGAYTLLSRAAAGLVAPLLGIGAAAGSVIVVVFALSEERGQAKGNIENGTYMAQEFDQHSGKLKRVHFYNNGTTKTLYSDGGRYADVWTVDQNGRRSATSNRYQIFRDRKDYDDPAAKTYILATKRTKERVFFQASNPPNLDYIIYVDEPVRFNDEGFNNPEQILNTLPDAQRNEGNGTSRPRTTRGRRP